MPPYTHRIEGPHTLQPTHHHEGFGFRPGNALPFGASLVTGGVNFSIYSRYSTACTLVLFRYDEPKPFVEIPIPESYRIGDVWAIVVLDLDYNNIEYGFRLDGPFAPEAGHRFNPETILLDPYAKAIGGRAVWGDTLNPGNIYQHRAQIPVGDFDWGLDRPLETPIEDLIIYEMHVRGFTKHPTAGVRYPGTYDAVREKIPYLKWLGVNAVELMPVFEFDEFEHSRVNPETGEMLLNYWGYSPIAFFAPKAGYAATSEPGGEVNELKALIKDLHASGIEVILDVVFNHTAEGNEKGPTISFKGIDNQMYYILTPEGYYYNFSGTGNTFNCNHPTVRRMILDCLRYWVSEYHVDGFRFDLASIMTRDVNGMPLPDPPLLRELAFDPILGGTKLIAEPWDADGLYHQGSFPAYGRWAEWNGRYRDTLRRFLKGDAEQVGALAQALLGSPDLYPGRGPIATINFITAHDGFTLMDLVSYNDKHNEANFEPGDSGTNANYSWNCGWEGPTDDPEINDLRRRQVQNAIAMLLVSQGVPMILMGDEAGRTQCGNNNAYCQDTEISWLNWRLLDQNRSILEFVRKFIAFRRAHPVLRNGYFLRHEDYNNVGCGDISWHGVRVNKPNWSAKSHRLAFMLCGEYAKGGLADDDHIYVAMNMHWQNRSYELPPLPEGQRWHLFAYTGDPHNTIYEPGHEPPLDNQASFSLKSRSVLVLVGK
ncbi:MAG: glycogen debranching protein GlgX [Chloroflexi bacterium]|nr:glycogen debranching protein GlgX [Chloroflexota bacterium]